MNKQQTEMKEYLSQAFRIDQRIQSKMEQVICAFRANMYTPKGK